MILQPYPARETYVIYGSFGDLFLSAPTRACTQTVHLRGRPTFSDRTYVNVSSAVGIYNPLLPRSERVGQISAPSRVLLYIVFRGTQPRRLRAATKRQSAYGLSRKALLSHTTISRTFRFCHGIGHTVSASSDCCYPVVSLVLGT